MFEPPLDLSEQALREPVRDLYGLAATCVTFLPIGHDSAAWVYRVETQGGDPFFLKVRRNLENRLSLVIPHYLHEQGITQVVAPLPNATGALWSEAHGYTLILYPFVTGVAGKDCEMPAQAWIDYGATVRRVHETPVPPALAGEMRHETFIPEESDVVRDLNRMVAANNFEDPIQAELARFWCEHQHQIITLAARAEELGHILAERNPSFVLCHADIHTGNVMLDDNGQIWIVDWDEVVLAPRERDLMFAAGGISREFVSPEQEALFFTGYGDTAIDPVALAYYRYAWAVSDIGAYGAQIFETPDPGVVTRQSALDILRGLFGPGEIVEIARVSEEHLL